MNEDNKDLTKFCTQGLSLEACEAKAADDLSRAARILPEGQYKKLELNLAHLKRSRECACVASWIALYDARVSRV